MTTTLMRNSKIGDNWIRQCVANNPVQFVIDQATGKPNGNILTGPVRLAFVNLFKPGRSNNPQDANKEPKYGTMILFPPASVGVNMQPFYDEYYRVLGEKFRDYYDAASGQYYGVHSPFRDQGEKVKFGGFTPGCIMMTCTSRFKPPVVDARMNPIVQEERVYAGVWAILAVNAYDYGIGKNPQPKKGVGFGVQNVMIIGDDESFGGGAPDPRQQFAGVNVQPPTVAPAGAFGQAMPGQPGGPLLPGQTPPGMPPRPPVGSAPLPPPPLAPGYAPPVGGYQAPAAEDDMSWMN